MKVIDESDLIVLGINPDDIVKVQWKKEGGHNVIYVEEDSSANNYHGSEYGYGNKIIKDVESTRIVMKELKGK